MNNKLTYKIKHIINKNGYTDIIIKHKIDTKDIKISNANVKFRYEPNTDKAYLSFWNSERHIVCEIEDARINEIIINDESLSIETDEKIYLCYINKEKLYY